MLLPKHTHGQSPVVHVPVAGGPGLHVTVRDPCVLSVHGGSCSHHQPGHPAPQRWPRAAHFWEAPCAELPTPPNAGDAPISVCRFLSLPTPFSRCSWVGFLWGSPVSQGFPKVSHLFPEQLQDIYMSPLRCHLTRKVTLAPVKRNVNADFKSLIW